MKSEDIIVVIDAFVSSLNISEINKLKQAHENCWKEFLNGNNTSQLESAKQQTVVIEKLVNELDPVRINHILQYIKSKE